jgi:transglutaminase-like putative cysteine protease
MMTNKPFCMPCPLTKRLAVMLGLQVLLLFGSTAAAGTPDWLRSLAGQPLPSYGEKINAVVVLDEQTTSIDRDGEMKTLYRRAYRILRPEGRERGTLVVYFDEETRLTYLKAWAISAKGEEYEVKEKEAVETSPFEEFYIDTRLKVLKIPAAQPGSLIGYEYEQRRRPSVLQDLWRFQRDIPVRRARFVLRLPDQWEYKAQFLNHTAIEPQSSGGHQWTWELQDVPAIEEEPSMPSWRGIAACLAVTYFPAHGLSRATTYRSWQDVGRWYAQLAASSRADTPQLNQKVTELTAGHATRMEKIRALAAFVQREVRYVAIEIGVGGYQPHSAGSVLLNRYGDCKDKATLLVTMLRKVGVDSFYVLTNSDRGIVAADFPSMLTFNHVILAIRPPQDASLADLHASWNHPTLGKLLFFDPTDEFTPLGFLPPEEQANRGLLVTEDGGELVQLPLLEPQANRMQRSARLTLDPRGNLSGEVTEVRSGYPASQYRARFMKATPRERERLLQNFLGQFLTGFEISHIAAENLDELDKDLVVKYSFSAAQYAKNAGNLLLVRPRVIGEKNSEVLEKETRTQPFEFAALTRETDEFEWSLPAEYHPDSLPRPVHITFPFGEYQSVVQTGERSLRYTRSYEIKDVNVRGESLQDLKKFFRQIGAEERNMVILKRTGN